MARCAAFCGRSGFAVSRSPIPEALACDPTCNRFRRRLRQVTSLRRSAAMSERSCFRAGSVELAHAVSGSAAATSAARWLRWPPWLAIESEAPLIRLPDKAWSRADVVR